MNDKPELLLIEDGNSQIKRRLIASTFIMAAMGVHLVDVLPYQARKQLKKYRECLLPGCWISTIHNGGYCSADHKRLSKKGLKCLEK